MEISGSDPKHPKGRGRPDAQGQSAESVQRGLGVSEAYVSISRIQNFLEFPERPERESSGIEEGSVAISMDDVTCHWNHVIKISKLTIKEFEEAESSGAPAALSNISIDFHQGQLTCIIGTVGCGKSALLQAIVGELPITSGNVRRSYETLAYAAQDPWIMDGTVKDNITLGQEFRQEWYDTIVDACGLRLDFSQFAKGDQTIVGDRGIQCSGGQRARIGLARALYRDADVLVADDPLSAVDAKVGRQLFNEAILKLGVNRGKTVILTTHQHQYVNEQRCVLVKKGRIAKIGSYKECVEAADGKLTSHAADDAVDTLFVDQEAARSETNEKATDVQYAISAVSEDEKEDSSSGLIRLETFVNYARAMGGLWVAFFLFVLFTITQASVLVTIAMMGRWAERPAPEQREWDILGLVIGLSIAVILLASFRAGISFFFTIKASRELHDGMTKAVLRAPISFFDTNPLGRILNRFSADVGSNDDLLPQTLFDFTVIFYIVIGTIATTVSVLPYALLVIPPLLYYFLSVRRVFVTTSTELKRLESLARSPIFAMISESLSGVATIRANDATQYFVDKFERAHDAHTRAFFSFIAASRW
eukprot:scaffold23877_cov230-Cylindrotheca_fusiformis.AAC.1